MKHLVTILALLCAAPALAGSYQVYYQDGAATNLPAASTTGAGVVQLTDSTSSTSTTTAATPNSVKQAYDLAASKTSYTPATPGNIGTTTPGSGAFTTLSATGQITSTVANGTAPLVVASTTKVVNLNAEQVDGYHAGTAASNVLVLDGSALVPLANIPAALTGKNAATATALAANGANCSAGSYPLGVDASGATENCTALPAFPTGAVVGTTDTQTLSGKTLTTPTVNGPIYSQTTSGTFDTAAYSGASVASSSITITNVVAGRYFDFKLTGTGAVTVATLVPTWVTGTPATLTSKSWFACKGTGTNTADCVAIKENY